MLGRIAVVIGVIGTAPAVARADGVGNEVTAGTSEATAGNPSTAYVSDRLWGTVDIGDVLTIRAEGSFTRDAAAAPGGWSFEDQGGNIFRLATSLDIYPSDHLAIGVEANFSPETETTSSAAVELTRMSGGTTAPGYAEVRSQTSTWGVGADVEYDSAGGSRFEWVAGAGIGLQTFTSFQQLGAVRTASGDVVDPGWVVASCDGRDCSTELEAAMDGTQETLRQVRMSANALGTIYTDTDVGLGGAYYVYTSDPTELGYFSLAALGRDQVLGEGLHYAPLLFTARPTVAHRIGRVQLGTWFEYGRYVDDEGDSFTVGLRVQVRVGDFRLWCAGVGQQDRSGPDDSPRSASVSLGARVRF